MSPEDPLSHRRHVIAEMLARTDWTPWQAVRYMRAELGLAVDELAKLSGVPEVVLETIDRGEATGTVEELDNLLGVLGLKLGVVQSPLASQRDTGRRIGVAKGAFEVPSEGLSDAGWDATPEVGREVWPVYADDVAAWAVDQAQALRSYAPAKLDWDNLADEILDVAKAERRELGRRVSALMSSLCRHDAAPGAAAARLVREHQKLVLLQLADCPSLERCLSDPRWLAQCWSDAVSGLGAEGFPVEELPEDNPWSAVHLLHKTTPQA